MSQRKQKWTGEQKLDRLFLECHEIGPRKHGFAWLRMNELMINAATACSVDYWRQPFKTLLTLCALKALNQMLPEKPDARAGEEGKS